MTWFAESKCWSMLSDKKGQFRIVAVTFNSRHITLPRCSISHRFSFSSKKKNTIRPSPRRPVSTESFEKKFRDLRWFEGAYENSKPKLKCRYQAELRLLLFLEDSGSCALFLREQQIRSTGFSRCLVRCLVAEHKLDFSFIGHVLPEFGLPFSETI